MRTTPSKFRVIAIASVAIALVPISFSAQGAASITSLTSNTATQAFLEGAPVELAGIGRTVLTDRAACYEFTGVPAGVQTLVVRYAGLDPQTIPVNLNVGERAVRNVGPTSGIYSNVS